MKSLKTTLVVTLTALLLAFGLAACEDILSVAPTLSYDGGSYEFTLPPSEASGNATVEETIATADVKAFIEKAGYSIDKFKRISVTAASLEILSGNATFDIVDHADVSFSADGTDLKEFASVTPEKTGLTKVALTVDPNLNFVDLFKAENLMGVANVSTTEGLGEEVKMRVNFTLKIQPEL